MLYLATHIGIWIGIAFAFGLAIGWFMWGQWVGIDLNRDFSRSSTASTSSSDGDAPSGSIAVLSDSLLKTQRELEQCQQSLVHAEARLSDSDMRFMSSDEEQDAVLEIPAQNGGIAERDDLKKIFGIGPVIEHKLAQIDITTYRQIVMLSEEELDIVSEHINYFHGRIERDGWLESARALHLGKYGEEI